MNDGSGSSGSGQTASEQYVKVVAPIGFKSLPALKGASLAVLICIALHQAKSQPGPSLSTLQRETGYTLFEVTRALEFLEDPAHRFIERMGL